MYSIDYTYREINWGNVELEADDKSEAEYNAINYVRDAYPDASDVEINEIKEV